MSTPGIIRSVPDYWTVRYEEGGYSGSGSVGALGRHRARVVGEFIIAHRVRSVVDMGCGDGTWLALLMAYLGPNAQSIRYTGLDISDGALAAAGFVFSRWKNVQFAAMDKAEPVAEVALSCDVIYHILNDRVYNEYMGRLFASADRYVIIYSSDEDKRVKAPHIRHRQFTAWVEQHAPAWRLSEVINNPHKALGRNPSFCDHYIYERA